MRCNVVCFKAIQIIPQIELYRMTLTVNIQNKTTLTDIAHAVYT